MVKDKRRRRKFPQTYRKSRNLSDPDISDAEKIYQILEDEIIPLYYKF